MDNTQSIRNRYAVLREIIVKNMSFDAEQERQYGFKARAKEYFESNLTSEKESLLTVAFTALFFTYQSLYAAGGSTDSKDFLSKLEMLEDELLTALQNDTIFTIINDIYLKTFSEEEKQELIRSVANNGKFITTCQEYQFKVNYELFTNERSLFMNLVTEIEQKEKSITEMKDYVAKIASKDGVSNFSQSYAKIADEEFLAQICWLVIAFVFGLTAIGLSTYSLYQIIFSGAGSETLYKLPFTLIFLFISIWTGHRYTLARRNMITYRHLSTTLSTYTVFNEAIKGEEQKNLLLFEIAKVLFTPPISNQSENQKEMANTIDLLKTVASSNLLKGLNSSDDNKGKS